MANSKIKAIESLPRKWVIKTNDGGSFIEPNTSNPDDYNTCVKYEADAFRYTAGEAIDFIARFPNLKFKTKIVQVTK